MRTLFCSGEKSPLLPDPLGLIVVPEPEQSVDHAKVMISE
jgi:hypothetical protein